MRQGWKEGWLERMPNAAIAAFRPNSSKGAVIPSVASSGLTLVLLMSDVVEGDNEEGEEEGRERAGEMIP